MMSIKTWVSIAFLVLMSGCNQPDKGGTKTEESAKGAEVKQQGAASWYGKDFHGKKTASGEIYNQNELTAASKTLPLGSTAKVTNPDTGRSVTVKINDRGPYVGDRVMDLSKAAANKIGIKDKGVSHVKIVARKPDIKKAKGKKRKVKQ
jgi:rare lipoprotein A